MYADNIRISACDCHVTSNSQSVRLSVMATESKILSQFGEPFEAKGDNYKARCKHCAKSISGSKKTCSNFTTHLKVSWQCFYNNSL